MRPHISNVSRISDTRFPAIWLYKDVLIFLTHLNSVRLLTQFSRYYISFLQIFFCKDFILNYSFLYGAILFILHNILIYFYLISLFCFRYCV